YCRWVTVGGSPQTADRRPQTADRRPQTLYCPPRPPRRGAAPPSPDDCERGAATDPPAPPRDGAGEAAGPDGREGDGPPRSIPTGARPGAPPMGPYSRARGTAMPPASGTRDSGADRISGTFRPSTRRLTPASLGAGPPTRRPTAKSPPA